MIRAHQPGSDPFDLPPGRHEPNPVHQPEPAPEPAPRQPVKVPEKEPANKAPWHLPGRVSYCNVGRANQYRTGIMLKSLFSDTVPHGSDETFQIYVHPSPEASAVIINYPGYNGHIDGFNNKYRTLGAHLSKLGVGAFIQMPNITWSGEDYRTSLVHDLLSVCHYARTNADDICGTKEPDLYLMGFSAGAGGVAGAALYSEAKKILLMAPSGDAAREVVTKSLGRYEGEVYIVIGKNDDVVGPDAGQRYYDMAIGAGKRELIVIPNCDHQFRGTRNGKIMSKAPLWAFAGDTTFPSPEGGLVLY